jgi:hypothetical protein
MKASWPSTPPRCGSSAPHHAVAAVDAGDDLVCPLADRIADARFDIVVELRKPTVDLCQDIGVAHPAHQENNVICDNSRVREDIQTG